MEDPAPSETTTTTTVAAPEPIVAQPSPPNTESPQNEGQGDSSPATSRPTDANNESEEEMPISTAPKASEQIHQYRVNLANLVVKGSKIPPKSYLIFRFGTEMRKEQTTGTPSASERQRMRQERQRAQTTGAKRLPPPACVKSPYILNGDHPKLAQFNKISWWRGEYRDLDKQAFEIELYTKSCCGLFGTKLLGRSGQVKLLSLATGPIQQRFVINSVPARGRSATRAVATVECDLFFQEHGTFRLRFTNWKGEQLVPADLNGKSDPYVLMQIKRDWRHPFRLGCVRGRSLKSHYVPGTLFPEWDELGTLYYNGTRSELEAEDVFVKVYDHDFFTADDMIGEARVPLRGLLDSGHFDVPLVLLKDGQYGRAGKIEGFVDSEDLPRYRQTGDKVTVKPGVHYLCVQIHHCRNLPATDENGYTDCFIIADWGGATQRSKIVPKNLNPDFHETLYIPVRIPIFTEEEFQRPINRTVHLRAYDDDDGSNDYLGTIQFSVADITNAPETITEDGIATRVFNATRTLSIGERTSEATVTFSAFFRPDLPRTLRVAETAEVDRSLPQLYQMRRDTWKLQLPKSMLAVFPYDISANNEDGNEIFFPQFLTNQVLFARRKVTEKGKGGLMRHPRLLFRLASLLTYATDDESFQGQDEIWMSPKFILQIGKGDDCDHSVLLCSLFLSIGMDAYVCRGRALNGRFHTWVMTRDYTRGGVTFWEATRGRTFHLPGRWSGKAPLPAWEKNANDLLKRELGGATLPAPEPPVTHSEHQAHLAQLAAEAEAAAEAERAAEAAAEAERAAEAGRAQQGPEEPGSTALRTTEIHSGEVHVETAVVHAGESVSPPPEAGPEPVATSPLAPTPTPVPAVPLGPSEPSLEPLHAEDQHSAHAHSTHGPPPQQPERGAGLGPEEGEEAYAIAFPEGVDDDDEVEDSDSDLSGVDFMSMVQMVRHPKESTNPVIVNALKRIREVNEVHDMTVQTAEQQKVAFANKDAAPPEETTAEPAINNDVIDGILYESPFQGQEGEPVPLPYSNLAVVFNHQNVWGNRQHLDPAKILYDFEDDTKWVPFIGPDCPAPIDGVKPYFEGKPVLLPCLQPQNVIELREAIRTEMKASLVVVRRGLRTDFYPQLEPLLDRYLAEAERQAITGIKEPKKLMRFEGMITAKAPPNHSFIGVPVHFSYSDPKRIRKYFFTQYAHHNEKVPKSQYSIGVHVEPFPSHLASVWVFYCLVKPADGVAPQDGPGGSGRVSGGVSEAISSDGRRRILPGRGMA
eukprot:gnl/Trimastix_PCT/3960.p1 GENE.gnl/Trimastix_PCT/3960~~gnl/Trimastix_PCT/3960.p1  ORF type:complete len:1262 (-),score=290.99 gnl/Trimastix_PCT/3960:175-3960(-)